MSEYSSVEKPFLDQLRASGWEVIDQGEGFPSQDPAVTMRATFRELILPDVFRDPCSSPRTWSGARDPHAAGEALLAP